MPYDGSIPFDDQYVATLPFLGLQAVNDAALGYAAELRLKGATASAAEVERALAALYNELEAISVRFAALATQYVIEEQESSRVRDDTGEPATSRMNHWFESDALPGLPGWVGFINKPVIDNSPAHWWWTNEIGYSGHVDRELHGWFFGTGWTSPSRPDPNASGEHPLFGSTGDTGPPMTIHNPIPARKFAHAALERIKAEHYAACAAATNRYVIAIQSIQAGSMQIIYAPIP